MTKVKVFLESQIDRKLDAPEVHSRGITNSKLHSFTNGINVVTLFINGRPLANNAVSYW